MARSRKDGVFEVVPLPIIGQFNQQRFLQFGSEDTANWYLVKGDTTKRPYAMYPTLGRAHINYQGNNILIFDATPRSIFKSINYCYIVVGNTIYRIDSSYNVVAISTNKALGITGLNTFSGSIYFTFLVVNSIVFSCFVDDQNINTPEN